MQLMILDLIKTLPSTEISENYFIDVVVSSRGLYTYAFTKPLPFKVSDTPRTRKLKTNCILSDKQALHSRFKHIHGKS
jgi:hypothetical protein